MRETWEDIPEGNIRNLTSNRPNKVLALKHANAYVYKD